MDERLRSASVQGVVTDAKVRRPLAGARVRLDWGRAGAGDDAPDLEAALSTSTDERGRFCFERVEPGAYRLTAAKRGYVPSSLHVVELKPGKPMAQEISLDPLSNLSGRVTDEAGRPLKGAKVSVSLGSLRPSAALRRLLNEQGRSALTTTTGLDGEFVVFVPAGEENITLVVQALGYAPGRQGPLPPTSRARTGLLVRLSRGLEAQGRIVDETGEPINGAVVLAHFTGVGATELEQHGMEPRATSGEDGRFVLKELAKGTYWLKVSHPGHASRVAQDVEIEPRTPNHLPNIVLQTEAEIGGSVSDAEGQPIAGAKISADSGEGNTGEATSDSEGSFVLKGFAPGASVTLSATAAGHGEASKAITAPDRDITLVLPRQGALRGRVEDAETLTPLRAFQIRAGSGSKVKTFRSEDGSFEWKGLPPGRWNFFALAAGYQVAEATGIEIRPGEPTEAVVFSLARGAELAGRVVDAATGAGLPDVTINYHRAAEVKSPSWRFFSGANAQRTDADGNFKFDGLPPARVTIIAKSPLHAEARRTVAVDEESFIEIRLSKGGEVSGRVVGSDATTPLAGASVSLWSVADRNGETRPADETGAFSFDGLVPGRYRLSAETKLGQTSPQEIVLRESERQRNLVLVVKAGATIRGRVTGLRPDELPVAEIVAQAPGDFTSTASTAPDGTYALRGVPPGRVEVTAQTYAQRSVTKSVEVAEGATELRLDIEFPRMARLSGRVTRGGQPVAYGIVSASPHDPESAAASGETDRNGMYTLEGLSEGNYHVSVSGEAPKTLRISGETVLDIELSALSLSGRVSEVNSGKPLSGVSLQVRSLGSVADYRTAVTDSQGRFSIDGLETRQYQLVALKRGFKVSTETVSVPALSELAIALTPAEGIMVRVRDGITGFALRAVTVDAFSGAQSMRLHVALDETGSGEVPQLVAGRYDLLVFSSGYAAKSVTGWTVPGSPLDLFLTPGGRLEIQADPSHTGVKSSLVEVNGAPPRLGQAEFLLSQLTVLPNLAPGEYVLLVKLPEQTKKYQAHISEGQTTVLQVK